MKKLKPIIRNIPILGSILARLFVRFAERRFSGSVNYWEDRYKAGGNSGDGSYGKLARFKANVLNGLVDGNDIQTVIELGCGDGNQLLLARYPEYLGLDVSQKAIEICGLKFGQDRQKTFRLMQSFTGGQYDLALSLDVIYHLVEDEVFEKYMHTLFAAGQRMVVVYSSNSDVQEIPQLPHVRHRRFTEWVEDHAPEWVFSQVVENEFPYDPASGEGSAANFFVFEKRIS